MLNKLKTIITKLKPVKGWNVRIKPDPRFKSLDSELKMILQKSELDAEDFEWTARYFMDGIDAYRSKEFSSVLYPGVPGTRGIQVEGVEGFARGIVYLATWLHSGRECMQTLPSGKSFDIYEHISRGIENGVDTTSSGYWGDISHLDQRAVEAGDIALVFWLLRDYRSGWSIKTKENVIRWLDQINHVDLYGGNWFLFKSIVNTVLTQFGLPRQKEAADSYFEFKTYYVGEGWFTDGLNGLLDYYNAWQMHYYLFWLNELNPQLDSDFILSANKEFCAGYQYLISPTGVPIFGRSLPYRFAVSTPLIIQSKYDTSKAGIAKRALNVTWRHFGSRGGIANGTVTQGYYAERTELLENYSGRGSSLWSLRSLAVAFYQPCRSEFWQCEPEPLPIERDSYSLNLEKSGISVQGDKEKQIITVKLRRQFYRNSRSDGKISALPIYRRIGQALLRRPLREDNFNVKYGRAFYDNDADW